MGADYWSLAVSGEVHAQVADAVARWLERKGFEEVSSDELRFEIDEEIERGFFLVWDARWAIVLHSHYEEMERLALELGGLGHPVLGLWLHDSDIWGYELSRDGEVVSAFHSNPRYFGPAEAPLGPNDIDALADVTGVEAAAIRDLQSRRAVFKERVCEAFARRLGIAPAASQYAYRFDGEIALEDASFHAIHRRFRLRDRARLEGFALHAIRARATPPASAARTGPDWGELARHVEPGQLLAMRSLLVGARILSFVLRPVALLVGCVLRLSWRARLGARGPSHDAAGADGGRPTQRVVDGYLVDPTERFRVRLVEAAQPLERPLGPPGLAFRVGNLDVHGRRIHGRAAQGALQRGWGELLYEEDFSIGTVPAKAVGWRRETGGQVAAESHCIYVQTPWLVYQFVGLGDLPPAPADRASMRRVVDTFEVVATAG